MFLETQRLVIRSFREEDFVDFLEFAADEEMCRMMGRDLITDAASARPTFQWLKNKEERGYALELKENHKVIGNLTVYNRCYLADSMAVLQNKTGRSLSFSVSRHYQRRGLAFEAVSAVIDALFREGADYVSCGHFPSNTASAALQKKLGFSYLTTDRFQSEDGEEIVSIENIIWREPPFLETERLILRKFREEDFADFCAYAMHDAICRMVGWENMGDAEAARKVFDPMLAAPRCYAIVCKEDGRVIGNFSVSPLHPFLKQLQVLQDKRGCVISFALSPQYRRRGLTYEAATAVIDQLFRVGGLEYVNAGYFDYNVASKALQEKLGFQYLATHGFRRGEEEIQVIENILYRA